MSKYFLKQKMMRTVLIALVPILLAAIYLQGWRVLFLTLINLAGALATEYLCERYIFKRKKISEAVLVTAVLYTMTLPVSLPVWISLVGIIFGVFFGKMVFGGFGKNIFNPAIVGRCFIYINFPEPLTIQWNGVTQLGDFPGGFAQWILPHIDDVTGATPMLAFRNHNMTTAVTDLLFGQVSGVMGETVKVLILLAAIYLIAKKVASWEIMAGCAVGFVGLSLILTAMGFENVNAPLAGILSGGFLFGAVFMATDPISSAKTTPGKWIFGIIIGVVTVIIRSFALFSGGMMFAILIANTFAPIIDYGFTRAKKAKAAKKEAVS
ncbi:RnfABCDGE type electron transport complex subunit D [Peptoniphilus equinus]|uniref:RnfABCDGE type electron transport complex subunit D n=1 Tax=Peptoniphilus equinus TaxID=3016343 RepID=A0ABY7QTF4_9FIRM|nr:RnfABCDGE type electron transport complex subunit D [Peptoniphilus equinus]WBW50077.1 RnfABCDGE type electron transport complex subunit D [Peptoniphilus equinus]